MSWPDSLPTLPEALDSVERVESNRDTQLDHLLIAGFICRGHARGMTSDQSVQIAKRYTAALTKLTEPEEKPCPS